MPRARGALLIAGTSSDAGKTLLTAGICRWLSRRGVRVAPFKAQNMALNSAVTPGGAEIGRGQALQAAAAGAPAEAAMNPVLIKPSGERHSQVVLMGKPYLDADARSYQTLKATLREPVLDALADLRGRYDVVVCEGAGSPAEINLRKDDLANMGLAREQSIPVLLVGDIDRGGVFAALYGTVALLEASDQALIAGFVINKFRGDLGVLAPGVDQIQGLTGRPVLGVLPWVENLWLDVEDSLALEAPRPEGKPVADGDTLEIAVIRLRWMSNFTDIDALACEPGVSVRFTRSRSDIERADLVLVPGTKATVEDLDRLRADGLDHALRARARRGDPILGVCGGYQLLGDRIVDHVESRRGEVAGLGILPITTTFGAEKVLRQVAGHAPALDAPASGYEIRQGRVQRHGAEPLLQAGGENEGCVAAATFGTSWHGLLEGDDLRRAFLLRVAGLRGRRWVAGTESFATVRERHLDRLGDLVEEHLDTAALLALIEHGAPAGLATLQREPV
jgi:adenosylcobyric acid synthase